MQTISFIPTKKIVLDMFSPPVPSASVLPEWYKQQEAFVGGEMKMQDNGIPNSTIKKCMPVLDDMTAGYMLLLESDVVFTLNDDSTHNCVWSLTPNPELPPLLSTHSTEQIDRMPVPDGYSIHPFKFNNYWRIKTPDGYSCMFRHPFWHTDLPFLSGCGIVDTDKHPITINFPFFIRKDFEGLIPAGTPVIQIIPFKREEWVSSVVGEDNADGQLEWDKATRKLMHRYKDNWRSIKLWK